MTRKLSPTCLHCGAASVLTVTMPASEPGKALSMTSCLRCENRSWSTSAGTVTMPDVLRNLSDRGDFTLTPSVRPPRRFAHQRRCVSD